MIKFAIDLYHSMLKELKLLQTKNEITEQSIESCFQLCSNYWFQLRQKVSRHHFESEEEEIDFFKNVNPLFISEIEYYKLLFHAALFRPTDGEEAWRFWQREAQRLERFVEDHVDFVRYILAGKTCCDKEYFLKKNLETNNELNLRVDEPKNDETTNWVELLAEFLSLKKYTVYVETQLRNGKL
jgi:hypothetical protein